MRALLNAAYARLMLGRDEQARRELDEILEGKQSARPRMPKDRVQMQALMAAAKLPQR